MDLKDLSLELYNKEVIVTIKPGTKVYKKFGESLTGYLINRIWEQDENLESTVIGITIKKERSLINIFAQDILKLEKA